MKLLNVVLRQTPQCKKTTMVSICGIGPSCVHTCVSCPDTHMDCAARVRTSECSVFIHTHTLSVVLLFISQHKRTPWSTTSMLLVAEPLVQPAELMHHPAHLCHLIFRVGGFAHRIHNVYVYFVFFKVAMFRTNLFVY